MKKLLSMILVVMLVMASFATVASAAGVATITASSATAKAGDEVSISFTLSGDQFAGYGMYITADAVLILDSVQQGPASKGLFLFNPANAIVTSSNAINGEAGVLFTAKFKVADDAAPGKYAVSVRVDNVADENDDDLTVTVVEGYVTVECTAHAWGQWTDVKSASCTGTGTAERICSACGEKETKELPALGHSWGEWTTTAEPTCTVTGKAERTCSKCGEVESKDLPATNVHIFGDWKVVVEASCTVDGKAERSCACGETETKTISATGHSWGEWTTVAEPSCTVDGKAERTCSKCGEAESKVLPSANAHAWGEWVTITEATCTADGKAERTCSKCGEVESKVLPAANAHPWGEWVTITEPSCTVDGKAERTCSKCGEVETKVLPAAEAHPWGEWVTITEATCTTEGKAERTCSKCGEVESKVLEATGHKISQKWATDGSNHWHVCDNGCGELFDMGKHDLEWIITVNPGNDTTGLKHQECKVCGYACSDVEIPAEPDLDEVPKTDDHTVIMTISLVAVLSVLLVAAYVTKRKYIK